MSLIEELRVNPGRRVSLALADADETFGVREGGKTERATEARIKRIGELVHVLGADRRFSLLVVLQGMDTSGKDGAIRHVFAAVDPQLMRVHAFKQPTPEELGHDFLWRIHQQTPRSGELVVFNRSQYEDVGIVRVHDLVPKETWSRRFARINDFERLLTESGTVVLKFFLHISKKEQAQRLRERLSDPSKNWKMDLADLKERAHWGEYMRAYSEAIHRCSTKEAPWYIVPSDHKWFRNHAIASVIESRLERLGLQYPRPTFDPSKIRVH